MQNNNVKSSQIASSANRNRDGTYFNFHLGLNASFIRYAEVEVWRRMRRWTHSVFFKILINGRNSFFNWSLHWRCRPDWGKKKLQRANEKRSENKQIQVLLLFSEGDVACFLDQSLRFESEKQRNPILHLTFDWTLLIPIFYFIRSFWLPSENKDREFEERWHRLKYLPAGVWW